MISFVCNIRKIKNELKKLNGMEQDIYKKVSKMVAEEIKEFERVIKKLSFDYIANLDDAKSNYLKIYLETRVACLFPEKLQSMQNDISSLKYELEGLRNLIRTSINDEDSQ